MIGAKIRKMGRVLIVPVAVRVAVGPLTGLVNERISLIRPAIRVSILTPGLVLDASTRFVRAVVRKVGR